MKSFCSVTSVAAPPEAESDSPTATANSNIVPARSAGQFLDRPETILVVEDDEAMRDMTQIVLQQNGFDVLVADSDDQALWIWQRHGQQIDLLLTDMMIPNRSTGIELARRLLREKPGLPVVYMSGFGREIGQDDLAFFYKAPFLRKPCSAGDMIEAVSFALAVARSRRRAVN